MRRTLEILGQVSLLGIGAAGLAGWTPMPTVPAAALLALGLVLVGLHVLGFTFIEADHDWPADTNEPQPLRLGLIDYGKALVAWLLGFRRTYAVAPGLYYTGAHYDPHAPLLVTANYHLSVFLVTRRIRAANARLLVIDTDGINVWCAAGKGRFSHDEIMRQVERYRRELVTEDSPLRLILPKFSMAGVDLHALRRQKVRPIVGPLYAKDLPAYLASPPWRNRARDQVSFGLQSRAFVLLPGLIQMTALAALIAATLWVLTRPWDAPLQLEIIGIVAALTAVYALLFPRIPGVRFAVKGLFLGGLASGLLVAAAWLGWLAPSSLAFVVPFTVSAGILLGLEFTGNSAVSNYSRVKREIAKFLPIGALLLVLSIGAFVAVEVWR